MRVAPLPLRSTLSLLALTSLIAAAAPAPAQVWTPTGPVDGPIDSLDGHPTGARRLLAAAGGTLYSSDDEGATWTAVLSGAINEVEVSPVDPDVAYALAARQFVYRSQDGGLTWEVSHSLTPDHHLFELWADPLDPNVAYFSGLWSILFTEDPTFVYRTADAGASWEVVWSGGNISASDLAFGYGLEPVRLLSLDNNLLLRSEDDGLTWTLLDTVLPGALAEMAGDPATPGRFLGSFPILGTGSGRGLYESTDSGDSWHPYGVGLPGGAFLRLRFDPASPGTVYAAAASQGVYRSLDGGATWAPVGTGALADRFHGTLDLALTGDPIRLFAATSVGVQVADPTAVPPCVAGPATLCLQDGRFEARVAWEDFQGGAGEGRAIPLTADTGAFWFFRDTNLELAVKVLDGTVTNGFFWNFYGSLSNVPFTLTVRDSITGEQRFYVNPSRVFASRGDTRGFPESPEPAAGAARRPESLAAHTAALPVGGLPPLAAFPATAPAATGSAGAWTPLGPEGGPVWTLMPRTDDPDTVLAGSGASGIFRSTDGGDSWSILPESPGSSFRHVLELEQGPDGALYVLHFEGSIHRSDDGGDTWERVPDPPGDFYAATLAVDPLSPGVLYAGSFAGLQKNTDGGLTWQQVESFPAETGPPPHFLWVEDLTFDAAGETLWAATFEGVFRSSDGADSWQAASGGLAGNALDIEALAAVPGVPERLYAATDGGIYETLDGGDSWIARGPSPVTLVYTLVVDPADPAHLFTTSFDPLQESHDRGVTWQAVDALPDPVHGLTPDPRGNGILYAGSDLGAHRSLDGGTTWERIDDGLDAHLVYDVAAHPGAPERVLAATPEGLFRSADSGITWEAVLTGPTYRLSLSEADPETVFAAGDDSTHRSRDGGLTWDLVSSQEPGFVGVWTDPADADTAYSFAGIQLSFGPDPVWISRTVDGGESWQVVWSRADVPVHDLAIGPAAPGEPGIVLFSGGAAGHYRSTDGGATFEATADLGLDAPDQVFHLIADPLQTGRFLGAVAGDPESVPGIYETLDAGDSWHPFGAGLPAATPRLLVHPLDPTVYFAATDGLGVFRSEDRGATWRPIGGTAPFDRPTGPLQLGLTGDPLRLYAATDRGVWSASPAPGTAPCVAGATVLCLQGGRFRVEVEWQDFEGGSGVGHSHPLTGDTGAFWFFDDANLELFVKVLDATPVNGHFWVFYGSLSNVAFTLTVTDTVTGEPRVYENPARTFASRGDTAAF